MASLALDELLRFHLRSSTVQLQSALMDALVPSPSTASIEASGLI
jgi:hypothetical protein